MTESTTNNPRLVSRTKWYNAVDPVYRFLDHVVFARLFQPKKPMGGFETLPTADEEFLVENLNKHRLILWLNLGLIAYLWLHGLKVIASNGEPSVVVTGLLAPAMITGAAWYTVSFGGIPEKFLNVALILTFWMFLSFTLSMTLLTSLLCSITPWPVGLFVLAPIYTGLYVSSVLYDNLDGLKIGLDSSLLKFSRAALSYYRRHGFITRDESLTDAYQDVSTEDITDFTHYIKMLEQTVGLLGEDKAEPVANRLVASATDLVFQIVDMSSPQPIERESDYGNYLTSAHSMPTDKVDGATIRYLKRAISGLEVILGTSAAKDIDKARQTLGEFEQLRRDRLAERGEGGEGLVDQKLADYLFVQVFQQTSFADAGASRKVLQKNTAERALGFQPLVTKHATRETIPVNYGKEEDQSEDSEGKR